MGESEPSLFDPIYHFFSRKLYSFPQLKTDWVEAHLHDPKVRLIEVDVDTKAYGEGHIPGAVGFNWQKELQDQLVRAPPSQNNLERLLSQAGVSNDTTLVLYGDTNNWFARRPSSPATRRSEIEAGVSTGYPSLRYLAGGRPTSRLKALRKATSDS